MRHKIHLLVPQNREHIEITKKYAAQRSSSKYRFLHAHCLFNEKNLDFFADEPSLIFPFFRKWKFYRLGAVARMVVAFCFLCWLIWLRIWVLRHYKVARIVYCNDGCFQRATSFVFKESKTIMLLKGMVFRELDRKILKFIKTIRSRRIRSFFQIFSPSQIGDWDTDFVIVSNSVSAEILRERNLFCKIRCCPRFFLTNKQLEEILAMKDPKRVKTVIFISQAFKWHQKDKYELIEKQMIRLVRTVCEELNLEFYIQPHPRDYEGKFSDLIDGMVLSGNLMAALEKADRLVSLYSSVLVEVKGTGLKGASVILDEYLTDFGNNNLEQHGVIRITDTYALGNFLTP